MHTRAMPYHIRTQRSRVGRVPLCAQWLRHSQAVMLLMLIKELEDVLALVNELPRKDQLKCAQALMTRVEEWEERQQHPHLSDVEWRRLKSERVVALHALKEPREYGRSALPLRRGRAL